MNFLAHFHLAGTDPGFIIGALLGDFTKGPINSRSFHKDIAFNSLPMNTIKGVRLHRAVDAAFDRHTALKKLSALMPKESQRLHGIILDLFFDYVLSHHWERYCNQPLQHFAQKINQTLSDHQGYFCTKSSNFCRRLIEHQLLERYGERSLIYAIAERLGQRLGQKKLMMQSTEELWAHEKQCIPYFFEIYSEMQAIASDRRKQLLADDPRSNSTVCHKASKQNIF